MVDETKKEIPESQSRRKFIRNTGYVVGGVVVGGAVGSLLPFGNKTKEINNNKISPTKAENFNQALMYFTQEQFNIVQAATERIFPEDENGPGAKALGVAFLSITSSQAIGDLIQEIICKARFIKVKKSRGIKVD